MKKFFTLLALMLLCSVGAWAQSVPTAGKVYTIKAHFTSTGHSDLYLTNNGSSNLQFTTEATSSQSYWVACSSGNASRPWKFQSGYGDGRYLDGNVTGALSTNGLNVSVGTVNTNYFYLQADINAGTRYLGTWNASHAAGFGTWSGCFGQNHSTTNWSTNYVIEEIPNLDVYTVHTNATISVSIDGYAGCTTVSDGGLVIVPSDTELQPSNFEYGDADFSIDENAKTITATYPEATFIFPALEGAGTFETTVLIEYGSDVSSAIPSIDFFNATGLSEQNTILAADNRVFHVQGSWNFPIPFNRVTRLHGANHTRWIVYNSDTRADFLPASDNFERKNYWYFTYAGMKDGKVLVNMYNLASNNPASVANGNDGTNVRFNNGTATNFVITKNVDGFNICHPDNLSSRFNKYGDQLKFWATGGDDNDANNRFHIKTDVFDTDLAGVTTIPGDDNSLVLGAHSFAVNAAKKSQAISTKAPADVKALFINDFAEEVELGAVYTMKMEVGNRLISAVPYADCNGENLASLDIKNSTQSVMADLWSFESDGAEGYYIKHVNSGKYVGNASRSTIVNLGDDKISYSVIKYSHDNSKQGFVLTTNKSMYLNTNGNITNLVGWNGSTVETSDGSRAILTKVTSLPLTIKTSKWASACYPVAVTLPAELTAYYAVKASSEGIGLDAVEGKVVPANTPVVITGEAGAYNLTIGGEADAIEGNLFTGTTVARQGYNESEGYRYGLSSGNFVRITGTSIAANKAFIESENDLAAAGSALRVYIFEDTLTGIDAVETPAEQGAYFDLNGRMVAYPTTGVYVRNGKKIFVK